MSVLSARIVHNDCRKYVLPFLLLAFVAQVFPFELKFISYVGGGRSVKEWVLETAAV